MQLNFVSDEDLTNYTEQVVKRVTTAYQKAEIKLHSNILDPFSALFDTMRQDIKFEEWLNQEKTRQVQKTLQNAVGDFHQNILGSVEGWVNPGRGGGYDLINEKRKLVAEVKNKYNTMNSSSAEATYHKLEKYVDGELKGFTGYVAFIVPKRPEDYDTPWSPNAKTMKLRKDIRKIDGESFYKLVTGKADSLKKLYEALPSVIAKVLEKDDLPASERELFMALFKRAFK